MKRLENDYILVNNISSIINTNTFKPILTVSCMLDYDRILGVIETNKNSNINEVIGKDLLKQIKKMLEVKLALNEYFITKE
jgi:exonuclease I